MQERAFPYLVTMLPLLTALALTIVGFVLLIKGADWLVEGGSALARLFRVSELVIGLTIVSLGTSMPEMVVSISAGLRQAGELVLGNVIGSNIMNTLLVLGATGLIAKGGLPFTRNTVLREIPFSLLAGLALLFVANDAWFADRVWAMAKQGLDAGAATGMRLPAGWSDQVVGVVSRNDGLVLFCFFLIFTAYVITVARANPEEFEEGTAGEMKPARAGLMLAGGVVMLAGGGHLAVEGGVRLAELAGVSQKLIGLLLLAGGTSLPELVTSVVAARRGKPGIAVGNVLGSNIANIFLVLGLTSVMTPLAFDGALNVDLSLVILSSLLLLFFMFLSEDRRRFSFSASKFKIEKLEAAAFLLAYLGYCVFLFVRA